MHRTNATLAKVCLKPHELTHVCIPHLTYPRSQKVTPCTLWYFITSQPFITFWILPSRILRILCVFLTKYSITLRTVIQASYLYGVRNYRVSQRATGYASQFRLAILLHSQAVCWLWPVSPRGPLGWVKIFLPYLEQTGKGSRFRTC